MQCTCTAPLMFVNMQLHCIISLCTIHQLFCNEWGRFGQNYLNFLLNLNRWIKNVYWRLSCECFLNFPDAGPPVISCHPTNITILTSGQKPQKVDNLDQLEPKSCQDNSGHCALIPSPYNEGHLFALGETIISHTAVDPSGNNRTCSYVVSVIGKLCTQIKKINGCR